MTSESFSPGDAVLKMLAIFVRMRCGLPVILMGECGCGKTELVRYLCAWSKLPLVTLNVHGGTTEEDMDQAAVDVVGSYLLSVWQTFFFFFKRT